MLLLAMGLGVAGWIAVEQRDRAIQTLAVTTENVNALVIEVATKVRRTVGIPAETQREILERIAELQKQLLGSWGTNVRLGRSQAIVQRELAQPLLLMGTRRMRCGTPPNPGTLWKRSWQGTRGTPAWSASCVRINLVLPRCGTGTRLLTRGTVAQESGVRPAPPSRTTAIPWHALQIGSAHERFLDKRYACVREIIPTVLAHGRLEGPSYRTIAS
jgi:hypothetical protein